MRDPKARIHRTLLHVPCRAGLHRATYKRLLRAYTRLLAKLEALPHRRLSPRIRLAYQRQFENRIIRIRRALHLPTPHPRARRWYRTGEAALYLGISAKTLIRWTDQGRVRCVQPWGFGSQRHYAASELARVRRGTKI
jgi:excisionase family DNA binding protein